MAKMLWELNVPIEVAKMKKSLGVDDYKILRYFKMFMERVKLHVQDKDYTFRIMYKYLFSGKIGVVDDPAYGLVIGNITNIKRDPNNDITEVSIEAENNYIRKNLKVGKDVVVSYYDDTHVPPIIYLYNLAQAIISKEDIINQQDNMLRKPIVITGEGVDFDNAMNNAVNVLSGIAWINTKANNKGNKGKNIMSDKPMEVLNLQLGNAYKGAELWDSRKHFEEQFCDYLGYTTTKNEKRERMNTKEVVNENSVGQTFYKSFINHLDMLREDIKKVFNKELTVDKLLEEEKEDDSQETMDRTNQPE